MSNQEQGYNVRAQDDYVHLETWGVPNEKNVSEPVAAAIKLADQKNVSKLLDDIRGVNGDAISLMVQAKGVGVLWKLRHFKKVAIVVSSEEMTWILTSSLQELGLSLGGWNIKHFDDVDAAKQWLAHKTKPSRKSKEPAQS